jgi:hypothetical protein
MFRLYNSILWLKYVVYLKLFLVIKVFNYYYYYYYYYYAIIIIIIIIIITLLLYSAESRLISSSCPRSALWSYRLSTHITSTVIVANTDKHRTKGIVG